MAERSYNGRNLLAGQNADFENAPAFVAAQTTNEKWIDGTATGSVANDIYKWNFVKDGGTASARFDPTVAFSGNHSIKIDATDASGRARVVFGSNAGTGSSLTASMLATYAIRVKPNRQYTLSYRVKGITLAGSGGRISVHQHNSNGTRVGVIQPAGSVNGTFDWTLATGTFTTTINTQYLVLSAEQSSAGIQTLWFDDITLTEVLPARTLATSRSTATNRVAVRDMGTALRFDGVDDYVTLPAISVGSVTLAAWATLKNARKQQDIISRLSGSSDIFEFASTGAIRWRAVTTGGGAGNDLTCSLTSFQAQPGQEYLMVATYDETSGISNVYANGVLIGTATTTALPLFNSVNAWHIGALGAGTGRLLNGVLDEPRIWNRALSATEIQNLYLYNVVPTDGLVAEYLFDEATGTTAIDSSGNGNDGTITGATYTTDTPLRPRTSV